MQTLTPSLAPSVAPSLAPSLVGLALAVLVPAQALVGDVTDNVYVNSSVYDYRITHMTDIDQKRSGLPGLGSMYCVPASALNLFCYAANHGFPVGGLPPADYMSNGQHSYMTSWLDFIGDLMETDAEKGTTCCVGSALQSLVNGSVLKRTVKYVSSEYTPGQASMTQLACSGWILSFTYGRYEQVGSYQGYPIYERGGGHAVTLTRSLRNPDVRIIKYRDPNNDSSLSSQSAAANKTYTPATETAWFGNAGLRTMTRLFYSNGGNPRFLDQIHGIRPLYGVTFLNSDDALGGGSIAIHDPVPFEGSEGAIVPSVSISPFLSVLDVMVHPDATHGLVIAKSSVFVSPSRLRTLDLATGALAIIDAAPLNLVRMDWSGYGRIYAYDVAGKLYRLDGEGNPVFDTTAIPAPSAIAIDDDDRAVWVLSVSERKLVKLYEDFSETLLTLTIPTNVPMSGDADLIFDPVSGLPWFRTDAAGALYGVGIGATGAPVIHTSPIGNVDAMSMSDDRLYATMNGVIKVFAPSLASPGWTPDPTSPFDGLPGGSRLAMLRNSSNFDPDLHSGPTWENLTTAEIDEPGSDLADCLGDANDDRIVDGSDLSELLGAWGTSDDVGDLDQDGTVNGSDLAAMLGAWGPCPR
ncbi:MAG: hypothetical protein JNM94_02550 [Phycisphaerae bacterium]|nr:hypothetical protein [Phycisphaerae bacterium]